MVAATRSWRELGFRNVPESRLRVTLGPELFARLPESQQLAILGPAKFAAYRAGEITLEDLRGFRRDTRWGMVGFERSLAAIRAGRGTVPLSSPIDWQFDALNARFGRWSEDAAIERAGRFEWAFSNFLNQLSAHLSFGGMRQQPLSIQKIVEASIDLAYRYPDAAELLTEARALTRWHLLNKYRQPSIYVMRGIDIKLSRNRVRASVSPIWFPTSTTSNPDVAIDPFGGREGTTYILEVPVDDVLYTWEISPDMRERFPREQEYILRPGAFPEVVDAAPAPQLRLWYDGPGRRPTPQ